MRQKRKGEYVCSCDAYKFPHRFSGGKCTGIQIAMEHWTTYWGYDDTCTNCRSFNEDERKCEVLDGGASVRHCEVVLEFVHDNGILFTRKRTGQNRRT